MSLFVKMQLLKSLVFYLSDFFRTDNKVILPHRGSTQSQLETMENNTVYVKEKTNVSDWLGFY